jgi:ankyrin repeat protein
MAHMPLPDLVMLRDITGLRATLASGRHPDEMGAGERTALIEAAIEGDLGAAILLMGAGASVDHRDYLGWSALHYAADRSNADLTRILLDHNASVDLPDAHGNTPLFRAVFAFHRSRSSETIRLLVRAGADPAHRNLHGQSPRGLSEGMVGGDAIDWAAMG